MLNANCRGVVRMARAGAMLLAAVALPVLAQEPRVPYVPTPQSVVERMLQMAKVGAGDYLIDLGSGDGRIVVTAARKYGARGFGVDINPARIAEANENAQKAGVTDKVSFLQRDLFQTDFTAASVITMYLLPRVNVELRPKLLDLRPGTRIVSHDFSMEDWKPDAHVQMHAPEKYGGSGGKSDVYLWVIPAKSAGTWRWELMLRGKPQTYEARFEQKYQEVSGTVTVNGRSVAMQNARLQGDQLSFMVNADLGAGAVRHEFRGRVDGERINGSATLSGARAQGQYEWNAERTAKSAAAPVYLGMTR